MDENEVVPEVDIGDGYAYGRDDQNMPQRKLDQFAVMQGEEMIPICALDDKQKAAGGAATSDMVARGKLLAEAAEPIDVMVGPLREWCIEYNLPPVLWVRTDRAWYNLQEPAASYEGVHKLARTRFEICSRVYLLCTTLDPKQTTYKNVISLLANPFEGMLGYTEEEILEEGNFVLEQVYSLRVQSISSSGFVRGLRDRLKREAVSAGTWTPPKELNKVLDDRLRKRAGRIIAALLKHKFVTPFLHPVDPVKNDCPDYHEVVKVPMDLGTVSEAYNKGMYTSITALVDDVRLVWNNCRAYNAKDSELYKYMLVLEKLFESQMIAATFEESKAPAVLKSTAKGEQSKSSKKDKEPKAAKAKAPKRDSAAAAGDKPPKEPKKKKPKTDGSGKSSEAKSKKKDDLPFLPEVEEPGAEFDESRTCGTSPCEKNARVASKFCSDRCGLKTAYTRLKSSKNSKNNRLGALLVRARRARVLSIDASEYLGATGAV